MPPVATPEFAPGFRLSALDVVVLGCGLIGVAALARTNGWTAGAVAFVVGHFFLFCNVLRMSRRPELIWAGVFAVLAVAGRAYGRPTWPVVFSISTMLTVVLAVLETRRVSYHGVGWRTLNPRLPEWFAGRYPGGV